MIERLLSEEGLDIYWTNIWRNSYGRLFKAHTPREAAAVAPAQSAAGPDSTTKNSSAETRDMDRETTSKDVGDLLFRFAPDMKDLINPPPDSLPVGSDGWAISLGRVSVTPIRASFAEPGVRPSFTAANVEQNVWKWKL